MKIYCKTFIDFFQSMLSNSKIVSFPEHYKLSSEILLRTFGHNVLTGLLVKILRRLSLNMFVMFLENVILEHSGNLKKTSHGECFQERSDITFEQF